MRHLVLLYRNNHVIACFFKFVDDMRIYFFLRNTMCLGFCRIIFFSHIQLIYCTYCKSAVFLGNDQTNVFLLSSNSMPCHQFEVLTLENIGYLSKVTTFFVGCKNQLRWWQKLWCELGALLLVYSIVVPYGTIPV